MSATLLAGVLRVAALRHPAPSKAAWHRPPVNAICDASLPCKQTHNKRAHKRVCWLCRCARCGLNDSISPGRCSFHPALIGEPGPLLYGPEWHACKAAGHLPTSDGCYSRREHYYPMVLVRTLRQAASGSSSPASSKGSISPRPRHARPVPSA